MLLLLGGTCSKGGCRLVCLLCKPRNEPTRQPRPFTWPEEGQDQPLAALGSCCCWGCTVPSAALRSWHQLLPLPAGQALQHCADGTVALCTIWPAEQPRGGAAVACTIPGCNDLLAQNNGRHIGCPLPAGVAESQQVEFVAAAELDAGTREGRQRCPREWALQRLLGRRDGHRWPHVLQIQASEALRLRET